MPRSTPTRLHTAAWAASSPTTISSPTARASTSEARYTRRPQRGSIFKRGMKGVYQHCSKRHLHRYVAEFEFRYNNRVANGVDDRRAVAVLRGSCGKRLSWAWSVRRENDAEEARSWHVTKKWQKSRSGLDAMSILLHHPTK